MSVSDDLEKLGLRGYAERLDAIYAGIDPITKDTPGVVLHHFWRGLHSQWSMTDFTVKLERAIFPMEDGSLSNVVKFNCAEQPMMAFKALLFDNPELLWGTERAPGIMKQPHPRQQKMLGRDVTPFNEDRWNALNLMLVLIMNIAKDMHSEKHLDALLRSRGKLLVEASPHDQIWGIGMADTDPRANDPQQWLGKNWLGIVKTKERQIIESGKADIICAEIAGF